MQNLIVSFVRLSAAVTLYGIEQVQTTINAAQGGQELGKAVDKIESALNSLADSLVAQLDAGKKDTLNSVTDMTRDVISRSWDTVSTADPRNILQNASDLVQKSTEAVSSWMGKDESEAAPEEPRPAADVL